MDHSIRCKCGALKGVLQKNGREVRCVCYCKDCQAFARFLQASDTLDAGGGTDIIQTSPQHLRFTEGANHLASMQLSSSGMLRWYASCCNTPIGNTSNSSKVSFVGLIHTCMSFDKTPLTEAFGPVDAVINGQSAYSESKPKDFGVMKIVPRVLLMIIKARFNGRYKQTPFFDAASDRATVTPKVLSKDERHQLTKR